MALIWIDGDPIFDPEELSHSIVSKHDTHVEPATIFTIDDSSRAVCSCNWKGPIRCYEQDAQRDEAEHLNSVED